MDGIGSLPLSSFSSDNSNEDQNVSQECFAFIVHSQDTVNQNLPPEVDNPPLARQKRRRTSPEDHAILEDEYQKNPKPDKAARMHIVDRVALGEKEVQIWFQNRRQMTRRKTQSSQLYEIFSGLPSSQDSLDNAASSSFSIDESNQQEFSSSQSSIENAQFISDKVHEYLAGDRPGRVGEAEALVNPPESGVSLLGAKIVLQSSEKSFIMAKSKNLEVTSEDDGSSQAYRVSTLKDASSQTPDPVQKQVYLSNRHQSTPSAIHREHSKNPSLSAKSGLFNSLSNGISPLPVKRTSSLIRLSMSLDGKASVTTDTGGSPSPPRLRLGNGLKPQTRSNVGLQRSQSAIEPNSSFPAFPKRAMTGRSRDARTWEFYCDSDASNALTEQAEREQSGSAIGPISLIRSQSNRGLTANFNKTNSNAVKLESTKRQRSDSQVTNKPKLARASSSVARLQTVDGNIQKHEITGKPSKPKLKSPPALYELPDGDSDKENWEPGTQLHRIRRRHGTIPQASSPTQRAILKESSHIPSQSSSLDTLMNREHNSPGAASPKDKENDPMKSTTTEAGGEAATFISDSSISREIEDLEGVQNLLSLSQAAWR